MNNQAFILCVDDEPINITIMEELLAETYQMQAVSSGQACLDTIDERQPDLVLLDVNMPDMDGLETCQKLRNNPHTEDIPVIFVSALATESELMAGYQAGGDDYITKPFSEEILQRKIKVVLDAEAKKQQLREMTDSAMQALNRNQDSVNELDMVVSFLHDCFKQTEYDGLSKVIFNCLGRFELDSSLLILNDGEPECWFSDDIDRPMERQILLSLNSQDRIVRFGARMAINSSRATILIRNMPDDDKDQARLTDHLNVIIEGLEAKVTCMEVDQKNDQILQAISNGEQKSRQQMAEAKSFEKNHQQKTTRMVTKLNSDIQTVMQDQTLCAVHRKVLSQALKRLETQTNKLSEQRERFQSETESTIVDIYDGLQGRSLGGK